MSTTTMSHPSFSIPLFTQLVRRLRRTNARYNQIAHQFRCRIRPTHHAKRRAYRVGLHIDTSKIRAAWVDVEIETAREEDDSDSSAEDAGMPNPWPELKNLPEVVVRKQPATLSPLGLGLRNVDDLDTCNLPFRGPVPGAPRWRSRPLPEDECETEAMTKESVSFEASCTYDPVWRGIITTHVSDSVSTPFGVVYGGLGITIPPRHLKRKLRDVDVDGSALISRLPEAGVPDDGYFLGAWWSEAQRRRGGL